MQARSPLEMPVQVHIGEESSSSSNSILFAYCYLCQRATSEPLVKNPTNHRKVLGYVSERAAFGDPIYSKIEERLVGLNVKTLTSSAATFHSSCYRKTVHVGNYKKIREQYYKLHPRKRPSMKKTNKIENKFNTSQCLFCNGQRSSKSNRLVTGRVAFENVEQLLLHCQNKPISAETQKLVLFCSSPMKPMKVTSHSSCWKKHIVKAVGNISLLPMTPEDLAQDEFLFYVREKLSFCDSISFCVLHRCFLTIREKYKVDNVVSSKAVKELIKEKLGDNIIIRRKKKGGLEYLSLAANVKQCFVKKSMEEAIFLNDQLNASPQYSLRSRKATEGKNLETPQLASMGVISAFPDELLLKIFQYLNTEQLGTSVLPVCRRWRDVGRDPILWKEIILKRDETNCRKSVVSLIRTCPELRVLRITESSNSSPPDVCDIVKAVATHCPRILELSFPHRPAVCKSTLQLLAANCPDLETIDFSNFISSAVVVDPNFLLPLVKLKKLNRLNVGHTRFFFGDAFLRELAENYSSVEHLDVAGYLFQDDTYRYLLSKIAGRIKSLAISPSILTKGFRFIVQCRGLEELHLKVGFHATSCEQQLSCLQSLTNLRSLRLQFVDLSHHAGLCQLFREPAFAKLEVVELTGYHDNVSDCFMNLMSITMPFLRELTLSSLVLVTDAGLGRVLQRCHHLKKLTLVDMDGLRGTAFDKHCRVLQSLHTLHILRCPRITSQVINELKMKKFFKDVNIIWQPC
ncbi:F-box domain [Trinorchestia longiramus]|nr:F-box domain [Trinorchestia longiramus]